MAVLDEGIKNAPSMISPPSPGATRRQAARGDDDSDKRTIQAETESRSSRAGFLRGLK